MAEIEPKELPIQTPKFNFFQLRQIFQNIGMRVLKGAFQSLNFVSNLTGWKISNTTVEFNGGTFKLGGTLITISDITLLQTTLDLVNSLGGGTVALAPGTYNATSNITIPSGVTLDGNGAIIDFGNGAYQILIQGTNAYSTGTLAVNYNSGSLVGTGTTWTSGMVGRNILIGDYWYEITAFTDTTHLTISPVFRAPSVSGATYVIATTIDDVALLNLTLQNASGTLLKFRYVNGIILDGVLTTDGAQGIDGDDSSNFNWVNSTIDTCVAGMTLNNVPFIVVNNNAVLDISGGTGLDFNGISNSAIGSFSVESIVGVGIKITNSSNLGIINYSIKECTSHGIEFVSGNHDVDLISGYTDTVGGDGIKLTATSDAINISSQGLYNYTGYGINIAASTCDDNVMVSIKYGGGGSGTLNDSGTNTVVIANTISKQVLAWTKNTVSATIAGGDTRYLQPSNSEDITATEPIGLIVPFAGTIKRLYVRTDNVSSSSSDSYITVRKNGSDTTLKITLAPSDDNTIVSDLTHSFTVSAGDLITVSLAATSSGFAIRSLSMELDPS